MLRDRERRALDEIQLELLGEDPGWWQSFELRADRLARPPWYRRRRPYTIAVVVVALLAVLMQVLGLATDAFLLAATAGVLWEARRRIGNPTPPTT